MVFQSILVLAGPEISMLSIRSIKIESNNLINLGYSRLSNSIEIHMNGTFNLHERNEAVVKNN